MTTKCFVAHVWVDGSKRDAYSRRFASRADAEAWAQQEVAGVIATRQEEEGADFSTWRVQSHVEEEEVSVA